MHPNSREEHSKGSHGSQRPPGPPYNQHQRPGPSSQPPMHNAPQHMRHQQNTPGAGPMKGNPPVQAPGSGSFKGNIPGSGAVGPGGPGPLRGNVPGGAPGPGVPGPMRGNHPGGSGSGPVGSGAGDVQQMNKHPNFRPQQRADAQPTPEDKAKMDDVKVTQKLIDYVNSFRFPHMNDISNYEKLKKIGQGTFGEVFKARCKKTGRMVALKKVLMENEKEGFPITALREVKMLMQLKHENITDLLEVCSTKASPYKRERSTFYLVFTFCDHDLAGLLSNDRIHLNTVHKKTMIKHLLKGLDKIHRTKILHRDMKAANILLSKDGYLKLADFGLARLYSNAQPRPLYTNRVVTLWYRPPELLLGDRMYSTAIDIWGAGCIMAELWTRSPIMQGDTEAKQLIIISNLCGSITPQVWPNVERLQMFRTCELPQNQPRIVKQRLNAVCKDLAAIDLIDQFLSLDPEQRPSANDTLDNPFFYRTPAAAENFRDLMEQVKESQFEYTSRVAHAQRQHMQQQQQQSAQRQSNVIPPGQYRDMIF